jgi:hypothetical protein
LLVHQQLDADVERAGQLLNLIRKRVSSHYL